MTPPTPPLDPPVEPEDDRGGRILHSNPRMTFLFRHYPTRSGNPDVLPLIPPHFLDYPVEPDNDKKEAGSSAQAGE